MDEKTELLFLEEIISKRIKILNQGKRKWNDMSQNLRIKCLLVSNNSGKTWGITRVDYVSDEKGLIEDKSIKQSYIDTINKKLG